MSAARTQIESQMAELFTEKHKFLIIDTETTGLLRDNDAQIVEISAVNQDDQLVYHSLVKPDVKMPIKAIQIHGLTDLLLASAPSFVEIWPTVSALLGQYNLIYCYNAKYDKGMLIKTAQRFGIAVPAQIARRQQWRCMMEIYAKYYGEPGLYGDYKWQSLSKACKELKVPMSEAHRATGDCMNTLALMRALAARANVEEQRV